MALDSLANRGTLIFGEAAHYEGEEIRKLAALKLPQEGDKLNRLLGVKGDRQIPRPLEKSIEVWNGRVAKLIEPHLTYVVKKVQKCVKGHVCVEGGEEFKSWKLEKTLSDCEEIVCFFATIGGGVDEEIGDLTADNHLSDAYIVDTLASAMIEGLVGRFHKQMEEKYLAEKKSVTYRFSPGYCDWDITEQRKLFKLASKNGGFISLSDTCMMSPRKSISGLFGVMPFQNGGPVSPYNPCNECKRKNCMAKRK